MWTAVLILHRFYTEQKICLQHLFMLIGNEYSICRCQNFWLMHSYIIAQMPHIFFTAT